MKKLYRLSYAGIAAALLLASCADEQQFTSPNVDAKRIDVQKISDEMAKVRACVAHRGSTFWAPEETEAAWRWAR